ncbi:MAG TPA: ATP-binding protein [Polyangiaceae bacterium]|nr:ATP-binding protein [Polyangiaceae bacterium]
MSDSGSSRSSRADATHDALARAIAEHVGFVWGALTNVVTTTIAYFVAPYAQIAHLMIIHLVGAVLVSTRYGMVISTFTAVTGALAFDYFCIPPIFAFAMPEAHSVVIFAGMLGVALLVCWLNQGLRQQRSMARDSEARTQSLCELSLDLSRVTSEAELTTRAERHLERLFGSRTRLVLGDFRERDAGHSQLVGLGEHVYGYILTAGPADRAAPEAERQLLLAACADRVADAIKRLALGDAARRAQLDAELERNRNALLSAVSHDMKTPLASILTAASSLLGESSAQSVASREMLETIVQEADRMNDLITNLLSVTRLESGAGALNKEPEALDDLIFSVLSRFSGRLSGRAVGVDLPHDLPLVSLDAGLVDQLLVNLLENVLRYTPAASPIDVSVALDDDRVSVEVCDRGPGFASSELDKVFEKFYRGQAAKRNDGGTGLGLTISRAVARAHGGDISIAARSGGGAIVRFSLPCAPPVPVPHDGFVANLNRAQP